MDRQPGKTSHYQGSFHFVNKDASNLNRRDKEEAFSISSHVTNKYYQWAKTNKSRPQSLSDRTARSTPESDDSASNHNTPRRAVQKSRNRCTGNPIPSADKLTKTICWQLGSGMPEPHQALRKLALTPEINIESRHNYENKYFSMRASLFSQPSGMLYQPDPSTVPDPTACLSFQEEALAALKNFYLTYRMPTGKSTLCHQKTEALWQMSEGAFLQDKKDLHAWYGSYLALKSLYIDPDSYTVLWPHALRQQNKAYTLLRTHIHDNPRPSENIVNCIWKICLLGLYAGEIQTNIRHAMYTRDFVATSGGLNALQPTTKFFIILGENGFSRFNMSRPYYHHSLFDPGRFQDQVRLRKYINLLPDLETGYLRWDEAFLLPGDALSLELSSYILAHRECLAASDLCLQLVKTDPEGSYEISNWIAVRRAALSAWSMSLWCDITETMTLPTRLSRTVRRQLQASLCLAISYLWSFVYGFQSPLLKWLLYIPVQNLRNQLETLLDLMAKRAYGGPLPLSGNRSNLPDAKSLSHHECLLFLFFAGACSEQIGEEAGKRNEIRGTWHSERFIGISQILGLRTWREAKKVLTRFIYKEDVLDRFIEGIWEQREILGRASLSEQHTDLH